MKFIMSEYVVAEPRGPDYRISNHDTRGYVSIAVEKGVDILRLNCGFRGALGLSDPATANGRSRDLRAQGPGTWYMDIF